MKNCFFFYELVRPVEVPAISRPFDIAIRAARLYTAWLRYRSYVVVGLKSSFPTIKKMPII